MAGQIPDSVCVHLTHTGQTNKPLPVTPVPAPFLRSFSGNGPVNKFTSLNIWAGVNFKANIWDLCKQEIHHTSGLEHL